MDTTRQKGGKQSSNNPENVEDDEIENKRKNNKMNPITLKESGFPNDDYLIHKKISVTYPSEVYNNIK